MAGLFSPLSYNLSRARVQPCIEDNAKECPDNVTSTSLGLLEIASFPCPRVFSSNNQTILRFHPALHRSVCSTTLYIPVDPVIFVATTGLTLGDPINPWTKMISAQDFDSDGESKPKFHDNEIPRRCVPAGDVLYWPSYLSSTETGFRTINYKQPAATMAPRN